MTKSNFLESLIQLLAIAKEKHDFDGGALSQPLRTRLAAFRNAAQEKGFETIYTYLDKALGTHDAVAQEIILFKGISGDSPISDKSIVPLTKVAADRFTNLGGDPEAAAAAAVSMVAEPEEDLEADLAGLGGEEEIDLEDIEGGEETDLADLGLTPAEEEGEEVTGEEEVIEPEAGEEEVVASEEPATVGAGDRVAQEGDEDEMEARPDPAPLNDWKMFEWLEI